MYKYFLVFLLLAGSLFGGGAEFRDSLNAIVASFPPGTRAAILIINPLSQDTLYSFNSGIPLIPASNTKLFTTAVALDLLSPDFKIYTKLLTNDQNLKDGVINGNLYLKGFGNPTFSEKELDDFVDALKKLRIKKITGAIIGDESYFDNEYTREGSIEEESASVKLPAISALIYNHNTTTTKKKVRRRRYKTYTTFVKDPSLFAANQLRKKIIAGGISVEGDYLDGVAPLNSKEIASVYIKLIDLISRVNKRSDNYYAECLFKIVGAEASGTQGSAITASQAILAYLKERDIHTEGLRIVDGSGISRFNQTTVATLSELLETIYLDMDLFELYNSSLSVAGYDGTLGGRMRGTSAEYNFKGKTGTLNGVSSLSGFLKLRNGDDIIVSILIEFNEKHHSYFRDMQDRIVSALSEIY
ncbi:MAG: D-alanyl-D-alanine carboxypeptidase/D-alanyl-D-alanine-endopeptidase [Ignavibacteriaceae bacterium]